MPITARFVETVEEQLARHARGLVQPRHGELPVDLLFHAHQATNAAVLFGTPVT